MTVRLIIARPLPGTVGESRRVVHVFPVPTEGTTPERLTAYCGETFGPRELELLDRPVGMPCVSCLRSSPGPSTAELPARAAMTFGGRPTVSTSHRELDPLLLLPVRLFIACLLADMRWCEDVAVRGALHVGGRSFAPHVLSLRAAGYLEIRTDGRRTKLRLTVLGLDRLTEHVAALQTVARTAAELVAARRADLRLPLPPES